MASDAELIKEVARRGENMERDEERVEHESGIYNLSSETRELRNAGRKLVSGEDDVVNEDRQLIGAVKELQESVIAQRADITRAVKKMNQMLYEMRNMVERVESIYTEAKDDEHAMQQAALNGVNKAQLKAEEITLRNIDEATQRSKKVIDTMAVESKRRIERLAMVTLPDRMFHFLKWTALMLVLFILVHIVWQMF